MNNISEDYCSFEVSKLLEEKGFDVPCYKTYNKQGELNSNSSTRPVEKGSDHFAGSDVPEYIVTLDIEDHLRSFNVDVWKNKKAKDSYVVDAPSLSLAVKWMRIKHSLHISIQTIGDEPDYPRYIYQICDLKDWKCSIHNALRELDLGYEDLINQSYDTPEAAYEAALIHCLKHLI